MAMAARNRARTPVRIRCIKKTTPPETSCGTPEEAYKVPPSLTVAIRDQQLRLVPSRRPRPWTIWTTRVVRGPAGLLASPAHDADRSRAPRRGCAPCENSRYCRRASAGSWPYLPFAISSCVFLPCRTTAAARRSPLMPTGPPGAIRSRRVWRGLPGSSTQTFGVRLRTFTFARLTLLCNFLRSTTAAALELENGGRQLSRYAQSATRR